MAERSRLALLTRFRIPLFAPCIQYVTPSAASTTRLQARVVPLLLLGASGAISRIFFVRPTPINWDSVQFSLALDTFNLHSHQPHPPGYILYVELGRLLRFVLEFAGLQGGVSSANVALSILSVLFSAAAVPLIYWLSLKVFEDKVVAISSSLLLLGSPLALYNGAVGLTYLPEMALGMCVAGLAWRVKGSEGAREAVLLGVALGIAGGIRQTSLIVLLPLCIWALRGNKAPARRRWLAFGTALALTSLAWLTPLLVMSGGLAAYLYENELQAAAVAGRTSLVGTGLNGVAFNITFEILALGTGLAFGVVPLGLWTARMLRFTLMSRAKAFLFFWVLPPIALYAVSHLGQYGYLLVALPPLLILSALCARMLGEQLAHKKGVSEAAGLLIAIALSVTSAGYFLLAQGPVTAANITGNNNHWEAVKSGLASFPAREGNIALVMGVQWAGPFREAGYLLPNYYSYALGYGRNGQFGALFTAYEGQSSYGLPYPVAKTYLPLPSGTRTIVALDDATAGMITGEGGVRAVSLADGSSLYLLHSDKADIEGLIIKPDQLDAVYSSRP